MTVVEDIFYEHQVDLVFNGHVHACEWASRSLKSFLSLAATCFAFCWQGGARDGRSLSQAALASLSRIAVLQLPDQTLAAAALPACPADERTYPV